MSETIKVLYYALWIAHPLLEMAIAALMYRRGMHRKFKFFFGYIIVQFVTFAVVFPSYWHSYALLFYLYWICDGAAIQGAELRFIENGRHSPHSEEAAWQECNGILGELVAP